MEIVSEHVHRVLAYVEALNRHGVRPVRKAVNEFANGPDRKESRTVPAFQLSALRAVQHALRGVQAETVEGETFSQYAARLGWIGDVTEVELTPIGRALLKALNTPALEETSADVFEIVLEAGDPFAYAQALGALSVAKNALLVEPYFRLEQLMDVAEFDNIERVLVGPGLNKRDLELLATGLSAVLESRQLEIRVARALHDRYLIPAVEGSVLMLGMSLGGIGKKVSTITTIGEVSSTALRNAHETLWSEASLLEPKKAPAPAPDTSVAAKKVPPRKAAKKVPAKKTVKRADPS
jgi:hypothetical protein